MWVPVLTPGAPRCAWHGSTSEPKDEVWGKRQPGGCRKSDRAGETRGSRSAQLSASKPGPVTTAPLGARLCCVHREHAEKPGEPCVGAGELLSRGDPAAADPSPSHKAHLTPHLALAPAVGLAGLGVLQTSLSCHSPEPSTAPKAAGSWCLLLISFRGGCPRQGPQLAPFTPFHAGSVHASPQPRLNLTQFCIHCSFPQSSNTSPPLLFPCSLKCASTTRSAPPHLASAQVHTPPDDPVWSKAAAEGLFQLRLPTLVA